MINLKEYIKEGLFDDVDKLEGEDGLKYNSNQLKKEIIDWVVRNTSESVYKSKFKFDMTTTPITVNYDGYIKFKNNITSLTNGNFQWGFVSGSFNCYDCKSLETLKGSPEEIKGNFICAYCDLLTSLEGALKKVEGNFSCSYCNSLKTLEGAPKTVIGEFRCGHCPSLKSLKGAPKEVGDDFYCRECGTKFTSDDVKKVSNVKGGIYC